MASCVGSTAFGTVVEQDAALLDQAPSDPATVRETQRVLHQTIRKCYQELDRFKFNTAIAALMELLNHLNKVWNDRSVDSSIWQECIEKFLLMLAPMAPHVAEEMWERTGHAYSIHQQLFPTWDDELAAEEEITLVVQVNGKVRDRIPVPAGIAEADARELALGSQRVQSHTDGKTLKNVVYVPGRLVNVVVA